MAVRTGCAAFLTVRRAFLSGFAGEQPRPQAQPHLALEGRLSDLLAAALMRGQLHPE
jgi:hypothetical protein